MFLVLILIVAAGCAVKSGAQVPLGYWAWMGGTDPTASGNAPDPVYGTAYQFAPDNWPGRRLGALSWTDQNGLMWLFGGEGLDYFHFAGTENLNDLWVFDPKRGAHGEWAWMGGCTIPVSPRYECAGSYGTEYQFSDSNFPGPRMNGNVWVDADGHVWLFGGWGHASSGAVGVLNDLWMFDASRGAHGQWAWMGGSKYFTTCESGYCGTFGNYGALYQFDPAYEPAGRYFAQSWTDSAGKFWLFSGWGIVSVSGTEMMNRLPDLWVFDPKLGAHGEWAWMGGNIEDTGSSIPGVYGTEYQYSSSNWPSPREGAVVWSDGVGKLWMFGGEGNDSTPEQATLDDVWVFNPARGQHGEWAWMGGPDVAPRATLLSPKVQRPV
jgi:hypothetical protein